MFAGNPHDDPKASVANNHIFQAIWKQIGSGMRFQLTCSEVISNPKSAKQTKINRIKRFCIALAKPACSFERRTFFDFRDHQLSIVLGKITDKIAHGICSIKIFAYLCTTLTRNSPFHADGAIAQLVEQRTENPCVPGSIPGGTTFFLLASECSAVGSALRSGRRGRAFESPHSDKQGLAFNKLSLFCSVFVR